MNVFSTLLISLATWSAVNGLGPGCNSMSSQCGESVTPTLACDAMNTCCDAGCAMTCTDCTQVDLNDQASAAGATLNIIGDDAAMAITVSGERAGFGTTITGEGFRTFDCTGEEGFQYGSLSAKPANEDVGLAVTCTAENCCNNAAFDADFAASFTSNGEDAAYNVQFTTLRPLNNAFTLTCGVTADGVGGTCESGDFLIYIDDCQGFDPWTVPSISCIGEHACTDATFRFVNDDPDCTLDIGSFTCDGVEACSNVRVYTTGLVNLVAADCTCSGTDACTTAGSEPAGFCTSFASTFSPTAAPVPTTSPTPCPTTGAPTTAAPTTATPTTGAPTTAAPTEPEDETVLPTTAAPTTSAPTTSAPTQRVTVDQDDDSSSSSSDDLAELEEVLSELNAAHANEEQEQEQETVEQETNDESGLFGGSDGEESESTNYEMVISLSNEALEHLWAIVITFVVFNAVCIWCYYNRFGGKKKRYGDSLPSTV